MVVRVAADGVPRYKAAYAVDGPPGFVKAPAALFSDIRLTPLEKLLWLALRDTQDWGNPADWVFPRPGYLANRLGVPRRSVAAALARLRAKGALEVNPDNPGFLRPRLPRNEAEAPSKEEPKEARVVGFGPISPEEMAAKGGNYLPTQNGQEERQEQREGALSPLYTHEEAPWQLNAQKWQLNARGGGQSGNCLPGEEGQDAGQNEKNCAPYRYNDLDIEGRPSKASVRGEGKKPGSTRRPFLFEETGEAFFEKRAQFLRSLLALPQAEPTSVPEAASEAEPMAEEPVQDATVPPGDVSEPVEVCAPSVPPAAEDPADALVPVACAASVPSDPPETVPRAVPEPQRFLAAYEEGLALGEKFAVASFLAWVGQTHPFHGELINRNAYVRERLLREFKNYVASLV